MEEQEFDYNIRGGLLVINRKYASEKVSTDSLATATTTTIGGEMFTEASDATVIYPTTPYFGFDLGYDKKNNQIIGGIQYSTAQYTGNITEMVWKMSYDRKIRKNDFTYDNTSRLTGAAFGQYTGSNFTNQLVNYGVYNLQYYANGNIKTMNQYGLKNQWQHSRYRSIEL